MEEDISYISDGKGNRIIIAQEIIENNHIYYLTRQGVYEKKENGKITLASQEINDKYMPLLYINKNKKYEIERMDI